MQGKGKKKSLGCDTTRSHDPPKMTSVVTLTPYHALPDKVRGQMSVVRSLSVGLSPSQASSEGLHGQYVTLTAGHTTYTARLLLHKSFKDSVTIINNDAVSEMMIAEGDEVTVCGEIDCLLAQDVILYLLTCVDLSDSPSFTCYLKEQLIHSGLIACTDMKIVVQYLSQEVTLKVASVKFYGLQVSVPFRVIDQTQVHVENTKDNPDKCDEMKCELTFENIGGYKAELQEIKEQTDMFFSCVLPITTKPVKGILISGPAGSGKSLILEALQTKYGSKCVSVSQEDVKTRYRGETEQNLRQCFAVAASRAPCLLLLDDVDVLCGGGGNRAGRGGSGTGVITALLHFMDGLFSSSTHDIMVVGTVRHPESVDAALRRPGRLSCDVTLPLPDAFARIDILHKLLDGLTHDLGKEDLEELGERTPGYLGGDLRSVVVEAVVEAGTGTLTLQHLLASLDTIKPASLRDSTSLLPQIKLSDLLGYDDLKTRLQEAVNLTLAQGAVFQQCGLAPPSHFLLFGPPGCGKTALIWAIASEFHMSVIPVRRATVLGKYFGESEQNLARIFSQASASAPCIVHFENFEGLGGRRTGLVEEGGGTDVESRIINHLKVQLDGIVQSHGIFIFAETSRPDLLDTDLIRPGRFHEYHEVGLPDTADRYQLLHHLLANHRLAADITFDNLVNHTHSLSVAEVMQVCEDVKQLAREEENPTSNMEEPQITAQIVAKFVEAVVPSSSLKMCLKYKNFSKIYCSGSLAGC